MPHPRELRKYFGYEWRTEIRPRILARAGGVFEDSIYLGGARCERCDRPDRFLSVWEPVSELDVAHLDGDVQNTDDSNLAALCRLCHRARDYRCWSLLFHTWLEREKERRIDAADQARPLLEYLRAS